MSKKRKLADEVPMVKTTEEETKEDMPHDKEEETQKEVQGQSGTQQSEPEAAPEELAKSRNTQTTSPTATPLSNPPAAEVTASETPHRHPDIECLFQKMRRTLTKPLFKQYIFLLDRIENGESDEDLLEAILDSKEGAHEAHRDLVRAMRLHMGKGYPMFQV